jgi:2-methylisocitrate lyase-like PEP mutase family enzyme
MHSANTNRRQIMTIDLNLMLKEKLAERRAIIVPGAANALAARVIEDLGFEAIYITGAGVSNTALALPDLGFIGLTDIVQHTIAIRQATSLPLIVDADTGFGNALNVHYTVKSLELAGANGIQLEDQVLPKKCGHFTSKQVVSRNEAVDRVRAAVEARTNPNFQIIARTDARAVLGLDEAIERAQLFKAAGADVVFVEAPESREEIERIVGAIDLPHIVNLVIGGKTPSISQTDAAHMGIGMVLYANVALQSAVAGMQYALTRLRDEGELDETTPGIASFEDRQRLVRKAEYDAIDARFSAI